MMGINEGKTFEAGRSYRHPDGARSTDGGTRGIALAGSLRKRLETVTHGQIALFTSMLLGAFCAVSIGMILWFTAGPVASLLALAVLPLYWKAGRTAQAVCDAREAADRSNLGRHGIGEIC